MSPAIPPPNRFIVTKSGFSGGWLVPTEERAVEVVGAHRDRTWRALTSAEQRHSRIEQLRAMQQRVDGDVALLDVALLVQQELEQLITG